MDSGERPFGMHDPEDRKCEYCGDTYPSHHGLQKYCPEKFGIKNYCLNQQKQMVNQTRLAEKVKELQAIGMKVHPTAPIDKNKEVLRHIMGPDNIKIVDSNLLDSYEYNINLYDSRTSIPGTNKSLIYIAEFTIELIEQTEKLATFKIKKNEYAERK